ncbi:MAG: hypothetical protein K2K57_10655 [Oscillospiraceae bacterium]|nr:hypothetical protein [Oscillospiraceae bacterium]
MSVEILCKNDLVLGNGIEKTEEEIAEEQDEISSPILKKYYEIKIKNEEEKKKKEEDDDFWARALKEANCL